MKTTVYLRIARDERGKAKIAATAKPSHGSLLSTGGDVLPTVAFGITLDIPDSLFSRASEVIATLTIPEDQAHIAADVEQA